ncbi:MAG: response regulator transcription factor [bacterium]
MSSTTKIILVDDHLLFREGMKLLIETEGMGVVIAEASNGKVFLDMLEPLDPDLVLMDIEMPDMGGIEATEKAIALKPALKILLVTMLDTSNDYAKLINTGAMGCVLKSVGKQELENAIKTVIKGESYFSNELLRKIILDFGKQKPASNETPDFANEFTEREIEVLNFLCEGLSVAEIAKKINRSVKTVEAHRAKLLQKSEARNTVNLVLFAIKNKLVKI